MSVLNVAFYGSDELASNLAKKGDSRDVVSYVFKETKDEKVRILSLLRPLKHPESIRPLLSVLNVSRVGFVEVKQIDASLGEALVAMKCSEIEAGIAIINPDPGGWVDPGQVSILFKQAKLNWKILEEVPEAHEIREDLFSLGRSKDESDELVVPLDQKFNVQGIGVVGIGYVQSGVIKKHDQIEVVPGRKSGVVRSLQVMDDDVNEARSGDRVGVALRGVDEDDIGKGSMIVIKGSDSLVEMSSSISKLEEAPFQRRQVVIGDIVHASTNMQFKVGRVISIQNGMISIEWESPLVVRKDGRGVVILVQLDAVPMRIIGTITETSSA
tara:strand:- start:36948 stop:37928 length:981 start_codon:yes stop_codon:yes gene_type:complete